MSQHWYTSDSKVGTVTVMAGWDRPLQGYFMIVFKAEDEGDMIYSNLDERISHPKTFDRFDEVLAKIGLTLPKTMRDEILSDGANNVGNKVVHHTHECDGPCTDPECPDQTHERCSGCGRIEEECACG